LPNLSAAAFSDFIDKFYFQISSNENAYALVLRELNLTFLYDDLPVQFYGGPPEDTIVMYDSLELMGFPLVLHHIGGNIYDLIWGPKRLNLPNIRLSLGVEGWLGGPLSVVLLP
jgi:hypothetical protein